MAEQDWTPSTVTLGHLQKLMKHGFMLAVELEACRVPEDPMFPAPTEGYVVSFAAFYEQGFGVPLHQFLHRPLRYYGLEHHHPRGSFISRPSLPCVKHTWDRPRR
jgi:hypothetical protein